MKKILLVIIVQMLAFNIYAKNLDTTCTKCPSDGGECANSAPCDGGCCNQN